MRDLRLTFKMHDSLTVGSFKVTINCTIIVFIIRSIIFLMVINNGVINGPYLIKDH